MLTEEDINSLIGFRSGKLVVTEYIGYFAKNSDKKRYWYKCLCDCGNEVEVDRNHLKTTSKRATTSCGCSRIIHGYHNHPAYNNYRNMMQRVHNPLPDKHKSYIEHNIQICKEWDGHPEVFCKWAEENGFQKGLTLDRIDSFGDYCPENCRWATPEEQANNRPSYNKNLTFNGKTQSLTKWAKELGIARSTLDSRINELGMTVEEALSTPVDKRFSH